MVLLACLPLMMPVWPLGWHRRWSAGNPSQVSQINGQVLGAAAATATAAAGYTTNEVAECQDAEYSSQSHPQSWDASLALTCPHCPYEADNPKELKQHLHIHTGKKQLTCPHCPYETIDSSNLRRHIRTHTGEKPYSCPLCPYQTAMKGNLNRHFLRHVPRDGQS